MPPLLDKRFHQLKHLISFQVRGLTEELTKKDLELNQLSEDFKMAQEAINEAAERELKIQQDYGQREHVLAEKLHLAQNEEIRLVELTTRLDRELAILKDQLTSKDKYLEMAKANLAKLKSANNQQMSLAQEEINTLKNETNQLIKKQNELVTQNDALQSQVTTLRVNAESIESRNEIVKEQLEQCLIEIQRIQTDKETLIRRNSELQHEMKSLQNAFSDLNREYQYKTESVMMELVDTKTSRNELCVESRSVVQNVRMWLQEQRRLNEKLSGKVRDKNNVIERLKQEKQ